MSIEQIQLFNTLKLQPVSKKERERWAHVTIKQMKIEAQNKIERSSGSYRLRPRAKNKNKKMGANNGIKNLTCGYGLRSRKKKKRCCNMC